MTRENRQKKTSKNKGDPFVHFELKRVRHTLVRKLPVHHLWISLHFRLKAEDVIHGTSAEPLSSHSLPSPHLYGSA